MAMIRPVLEDMPITIMEKILMELNFEDRQACRLVCKAWKALDVVRIPTRPVEIVVDGEVYTVENRGRLLKFMQDGNDVAWQKFRSQRIDVIKNADVLDVAIKKIGATLALYEPEEFQVSCKDNNRFMKRFKEVFNQEGTIQAKLIRLEVEEEQVDFLHFVKLCTPSVLKDIGICQDNDLDLTELVKTAQFRKAQHFRTTATVTGFKLQDFKHLTTATIRLPEITMELANELKAHILGTKHKGCAIVLQNPNKQMFIDAWGPPSRQLPARVLENILAGMSSDEDDESDYEPEESDDEERERDELWYFDEDDGSREVFIGWLQYDDQISMTFAGMPEIDDLGSESDYRLRNRSPDSESDSSWSSISSSDSDPNEE